ncbi:MAG: hypothetical protein QGD94_12495 [Planctomycetia bacterium]|nr:hypothetical protein [Planctomycetia bacterium]
MRRYLITLALALAVCAPAGCTTEAAKLTPEANPYLEQGRIQFASTTTKRQVQVVRIDTERIAGDLLKVIVTFRNRRRSSNLWCDIRTTFLNSKNHVLEQTNWEPVLLDARTLTEYTVTSLSSKAADYQIIVRKQKKSSLGLP